VSQPTAKKAALLKSKASTPLVYESDESDDSIPDPKRKGRLQSAISPKKWEQEKRANKEKANQPRQKLKTIASFELFDDEPLRPTTSNEAIIYIVSDDEAPPLPRQGAEKPQQSQEVIDITDTEGEDDLIVQSPTSTPRHQGPASTMDTNLPHSSTTAKMVLPLPTRLPRVRLPVDSPSPLYVEDPLPHESVDTPKSSPIYPDPYDFPDPDSRDTMYYHHDSPLVPPCSPTPPPPSQSQKLIRQGTRGAHISNSRRSPGPVKLTQEALQTLLEEAVRRPAPNSEDTYASPFSCTVSTGNGAPLRPPTYAAELPRPRLHTPLFFQRVIRAFTKTSSKSKGKERLIETTSFSQISFPQASLSRASQAVEEIRDSSIYVDAEVPDQASEALQEAVEVTIEAPHEVDDPTTGSVTHHCEIDVPEELSENPSDPEVTLDIEEPSVALPYVLPVQGGGDEAMNALGNELLPVIPQDIANEVVPETPIEPMELHCAFSLSFSLHLCTTYPLVVPATSPAPDLPPSPGLKEPAESIGELPMAMEVDSEVEAIQPEDTLMTDVTGSELTDETVLPPVLPLRLQAAQSSESEQSEIDPTPTPSTLPLPSSEAEPHPTLPPSSSISSITGLPHCTSPLDMHHELEPEPSLVDTSQYEGTLTLPELVAAPMALPPQSTLKSPQYSVNSASTEDSPPPVTPRCTPAVGLPLIMSQYAIALFSKVFPDDDDDEPCPLDFQLPETVWR